MRFEYQYDIDLRDYKKLKAGQLSGFNGYAKSIKDCIKSGQNIISRYPEVTEIYFKRVLYLDKLGIYIHFLNSSLVFDNYECYQTLRRGFKLLWDSRNSKNEVKDD